jgi:hypothetical protein
MHLINGQKLQQFICMFTKIKFLLVYRICRAQLGKIVLIPAKDLTVGIVRIQLLAYVRPQLRILVDPEMYNVVNPYFP